MNDTQSTTSREAAGKVGRELLDADLEAVAAGGGKGKNPADDIDFTPQRGARRARAGAAGSAKRLVGKV